MSVMICFNIAHTADDSTDPVLTCPPNVNMTIELGPTNVPITFLDPIVFDFAATNLSTSHMSPGPFPVDATTVVTFTATDQSSNQGTCSFNIDFNIGKKQWLFDVPSHATDISMMFMSYTFDKSSG